MYNIVTITNVKKTHIHKTYIAGFCLYSKNMVLVGIISDYWLLPAPPPFYFQRDLLIALDRGDHSLLTHSLRLAPGHHPVLGISLTHWLQCLSLFT